MELAFALSALLLLSSLPAYLGAPPPPAFTVDFGTQSPPPPPLSVVNTTTAGYGTAAVCDVNMIKFRVARGPQAYVSQSTPYSCPGTGKASFNWFTLYVYNGCKYDLLTPFYATCYNFLNKALTQSPSPVTPFQTGDVWFPDAANPIDPVWGVTTVCSGNWKMGPTGKVAVAANTWVSLKFVANYFPVPCSITLRWANGDKFDYKSSMGWSTCDPNWTFQNLCPAGCGCPQVAYLNHYDPAILPAS